MGAETHERCAAQGIAGTLVAEAMHAGLVSCAMDTPLDDVARLMAHDRIHCVVVRNPDDGLWGVVSDLDLVAAAAVRPLEDQTAGASAVSPLLMVAPDATLERAALMMTEHGTAHLVVVDSALDPVGVLSTLDIAAALG